MLSVNSNYGASVALQSLGNTNKELGQVQNRISTGFKVASARDNGAVFAIAEGQRTRVSSIASVKDGIDRANSAIDVALSAGRSIGKILKDMKTKAVAAQAADLSTEQRAALQTDFDALRAQVDQVANSATFNGLNLVAAGGANLNVVMSDIAGHDRPSDRLDCHRRCRARPLRLCGRQRFCRCRRRLDVQPERCRHRHGRRDRVNDDPGLPRPGVDPDGRPRHGELQPVDRTVQLCCCRSRCRLE